MKCLLKVVRVCDMHASCLEYTCTNGDVDVCGLCSVTLQVDEDILAESFRLQGWECTVATSFEKLLSFSFHTLRQFDVILVTNEFNRK
jgi:hypothetical protein